MHFGEKVKLARRQMGLNRKELATLAGVAEKSLYSYEQRGRMPRQDVIRKLAQTLSVSVSYLLNDDEQDPRRNIENEAFVASVREEFGARGARQAEQALGQVAALFAGGELDEEAEDIFFQKFTEIYMASKAKAREKYTPRRRRRSIE